MTKWFFSYKNNDINCTHAKGHAIALQENFEKMCNLMRLGEYFDQISGACPGIRQGGGPKSESLFFFAFQFFRGGAQLRK